MASPGDKKGQRRGVCGHIMASFDLHKRCARCRDKGIGDDDCVAKKSCVICDGFTDTQKDMLATPTYKIRKDKKAGVLVSPDQVTVIASVEDTEPVFQPSPSASQPPAHAQPESSSSAFVTSDQLQKMSDQWAEQFARFEALLSRGNVFSTPKSSVQHVPSHAAISDTPFIPPSARLTGPVEFPAEGEGDKQQASKSVERDVKVRSFMGWNHIPTFESDLSEPDKSNNPWKGKLPKRPARISVAMPPDDWLCQKLEKLNTVVAEGYPSRSQDSAGLKKDQFVKVPKSQNRWYQMHMIRPEGPHRPGKTLFSWHNSEAKVNSQFPRIVKASAYPATGPPSRPISQEYLRRWEKCARENSYIVNHAAGFNRCTSELQERMTGHVSMLHARINKGKAPKEVSAALSDLKDLSAFHQNVSVAMGTALQHLADSLFVHMSNLTLLRRDSYLDHVKNGIKPDTYNQLRNAPLFGHGLFPDAVIRTAEQDIASHHSSGSVPRPGPGAAQQTGWRSSHRYRPYDSRDSRNTGTGDQDRQAWRQFSRNRGRGRGRGRGSNPRFSKSRG